VLSRKVRWRLTYDPLGAAVAHLTSGPFCARNASRRAKDLSVDLSNCAIREIYG
jgi:hypothetical protein